MGNKTGNRRKVWTDSEIAYLREHYPSEPTVDVADFLGVAPETVNRKAQELGIEKSPDYKKSDFHNRYVNGYKSERYKNYK